MFVLALNHPAHSQEVQPELEPSALGILGCPVPPISVLASLGTRPVGFLFRRAARAGPGRWQGLAEAASWGASHLSLFPTRRE